MFKDLKRSKRLTQSSHIIFNASKIGGVRMEKLCRHVN